MKREIRWQFVPDFSFCFLPFGQLNKDFALGSVIQGSFLCTAHFLGACHTAKRKPLKRSAK